MANLNLLQENCKTKSQWIVNIILSRQIVTLSFKINLFSYTGR